MPHYNPDNHVLGQSPDKIQSMGNTLRDLSQFREILRHISQMEECIFIVDTFISPTINLSDFIRDGMKFTIPYNTSSEQFHPVQLNYENLESIEYLRECHEDSYYFKRSVSGFL